MSGEGPCTGLTVVEIAVGVSDLGLGLAAGLPGMLLADLGARVVRVVGEDAPIDAAVPWGRVWHRDKRILTTSEAAEISELLRTADIALVYGPEDLVEARGLGFRECAASNPALVYARCRPSRTAAGTVEDFGLLVEARAGFCTQLRGHRPGPIFPEVRASGMGAAFLLLTSVFALLHRRVGTGTGGWSETSLYDGMLATLGCMIGRSERAAPEVESYWEHGSTFPNFLYRCADGELLQVWFGGKGMYQAVIEVLGDEPSPDGYYTDQTTGKLRARAQRWTSLFATRPREEWIERLRAAGVACEPVLGPGEVLRDPHTTATGLAVTRSDRGHEDLMIGSPFEIHPLRPASGLPRASRTRAAAGLFEGLRVVDFSAFVAGPLAAEVLADLGADVIKVEPPSGEAMRAAAYAVAACQRGKRSLALDINAPEARPVVRKLLTCADVVLHNFRVGVAERLGIDADTVARLNPNAVYCHASAFGATGPRAAYPGNDALMQALTGFERAIGGADNEPLAATWIPIDMAGGWVAAAGIALGLYARATQQRGQQVITSLLGAGMLMHCGVFVRDGELVADPALDERQTGYGPGYRIYEGSDSEWFALVVADAESWWKLDGFVAAAAGGPSSGLGDYVPLRSGGDDSAARAAEATLEFTFATAPAADWVRRLRELGILAELIEPMDRNRFRHAILDDPVNHQIGRVVGYRTADWGYFEQIGPLLRTGPDVTGGPRLMIPGVGEHTAEVLRELGFDDSQVDELLATKVARQMD
ncbi:carnitine dehydratase [Nocardia sp. 852002-20019_SCH5090214]|uniref:CaiB/BaiF CoA-transferase family protein n=1 Tax=Nocardia sp. 852002-20019_SCH5090214 TaxID=1834087 RepID=UPI0007EBCA06|nr:CoA transferase [Nocardia sp. 852002-20019_SCH5090214]OBA44185.1 carnitine dehydratase [Nocardia sp. 852002-20019_SCH5090214]